MIPVGIGLAYEIDTNMAMRAIMYSFGSSVQDAEGNPCLDSKETLEAVKFVKALFDECMTDEVFTWDASANNRFMISGKGSLALNAISITRTAEKTAPDMAKKIWLAKACKGPVRRMGLEHVMDVYVIWKFAENIDGAKKFLVDYISNFRRAFLASEFYNFPCWPWSDIRWSWLLHTASVIYPWGVPVIILRGWRPFGVLSRNPSLGRRLRTPSCLFPCPRWWPNSGFRIRYGRWCWFSPHLPSPSPYGC